MKTKSNNLSYIQMFKSIFNFQTFTKQVSNKTLIFGNLTLLTAVLIVTLITSLLTYTFSGILNLTSLIFIGLPTFLLTIFSFMYLFLSSYESLKQKFFNSYFIYTFITLNFVFIGNLLTLIKMISQNNFLINFVNLLLFLTIIYYFITITLTLKNIFKINWERSFLTQIMTYIVLSLGIVAQYLTYLISIIKNN